MMNSLIGYIFKKSPQITRKSLVNLQQLFSIIDERPYETNDKLYARFQFIQKAIEARVSNGMENEGVMLNYCSSDNNNLENQEILNNVKTYKKLNYEEITYINKAVQDRLRYSFIAEARGPLYEVLEKLETGNYSSYKEINAQMVDICKNLIDSSKSANVVDQTDTFSLDPTSFVDNVTTIVDKLKDPARILRTGIQKWNEILVRGYRSRRVYYYLGLPAGFKSGILLKSAMDIKKYNKGIPSRKEGARKSVLIVTMENTVDETVERMFNMAVTSDDIRDFDTKEIIRLLREEGEFVLKDKDDIDIVIKYYPNRSISTDDLYTIIDDLEDDGREIIALILDYIKRIRPAEFAREEKEELKNITNELKTLSIIKDIPVITAHQLNRGAATVVDAAIESSKEDIARQIGRSNVGSACDNAPKLCTCYTVESILTAGTK